MNGMSEQEIMDELGVAPIEEDTGEEEKDVADPSDTEDPEGEEEKDVADPSYDKNSEHVILVPLVIHGRLQVEHSFVQDGLRLRCHHRHHQQCVQVGISFSLGWVTISFEPQFVQ